MQVTKLTNFGWSTFQKWLFSTLKKEQAELVMNQIHAHEPAAGPGAAWAAAQGVGPVVVARPIMALRPKKLSFGNNLGALRRWKQRYTAFHQSSNFRILPIIDQQAFLLACIDDDIANRIIRVVTETQGKQMPRSRQEARRGGNASNSNPPPPSREEIKRREMMQGRCFRCGRSDHMLPDCTMPAHRTCGICGKRGHAKLACSKNSANAAAASQPDSSLTQHMQDLSLSNTLTPTYGAPQPSHADYAGASAYTCQHPNQPTPTVLL